MNELLDDESDYRCSLIVLIGMSFPVLSEILTTNIMVS